ncbi:hypothetical protein [Mesorhizobium sp. Z1-4]|uniref:hypothetical protein n=1 Tax=Mesorhizobium sp. Z1-4 TaxID=2448478 RepID=UPI000FDA9B18|nr:hypothetical protein [Mesorhizobium sp. Z1-4]
MTTMKRLTSGDLVPGDILLHQPADPRWYERGIAWCTGSPYTHASIFIGNDTIAEARLPRVRTCSVSRPIRREKALCVLRRSFELTAAQVESLQAFVEGALKREARFDFAFPYTYYSRRLLHKLSGDPRDLTPKGCSEPVNCGRYFCTSFIVDSFYAMGLIDRSERRSYRLGGHSPADFLTDEKFGNVIGHIEGRTPRGELRQHCARAGAV